MFAESLFFPPSLTTVRNLLNKGNMRRNCNSLCTMTISQPNPVELAKQGDMGAISFLINRSLHSKGIIAKAILKDGCLQVMLEAPEVPEQQTLTAFIFKGVVRLEVGLIKTLRGVA